MNLSDLIQALTEIKQAHGDLAVFLDEETLCSVVVELNERDEAICVVLNSDEDEGEELH